MSNKVLIIDAHEVVRLGLRTILSGGSFNVVGEAATADSTLKAIARHKPDVVILDALLDDEKDLSTLAKIRSQHSALPVVVFSGFENPTLLTRAMALGANAFVLKSEEKQKILQAVKAALSGKSSAAKQKPARGGAGFEAKATFAMSNVQLTQREVDVLQKIAAGLTNKQIASELGISYETVKEHVQHLLDKIGVRDRTHAAVWAVRRGFV
jgi:DNA-binding NarL/FixJ family response regulator